MLGEELLHFKTELDAKNSILQDTFDNVAEIVYSLHLNGQRYDASEFVFISPRVQKLVGIEPAAIIDDPSKWFSAVHPEDQELLDQAIRKVVNGEETIVEYRMYAQHKQKYLWFEDRMVPKLKDSVFSGYVFCAARDITKQKAIKDELSRINTLNSRIIRTSNLFFYAVEIDQSKPEGITLLYASGNIDQINGASISDLYENPGVWIKSIHPDDMARFEETNKEMFSTRKPVLRQYRVRNIKTGVYNWIEDYVYPIINSENRVISLYGATLEINDRKKGEEEREQLINELNNRNNELRQFNYIVSHNLRHPVANIMGLAKLLKQPISSEEKDELLSLVVKSVENMDEMIKDLNTMLSIATPVDKKIESFDFRKVVDAVVDALGIQVKESNTQLKVQISEHVYIVNGIKSYMQSIIYNLLSNAVKYRDPKRSHFIKFIADCDDNILSIIVRDNGLGIDRKYQDEIFGLYKRFHLNTFGKGLGLYMTKAQVEAMGGTIEVFSEPGEGTEFRIYLPQNVTGENEARTVPDHIEKV